MGFMRQKFMTLRFFGEEKLGRQEKGSEAKGQGTYLTSDNYISLFVCRCDIQYCR